jgi:putative glycosyltransferase (TIGR04372 family)
VSVGGDPADPRQVVAALHARLQANPEGYEENRDLALYLSDLRGYEIAAQPFVEKALSAGRRDRDHESLLNRLAVIETLRGGLGLARATYETLHRDYPANPFYAFYVGEALYRLGRIDEASETLRRAGELRRLRARAACKKVDQPPTRLLYPHTVTCMSFGEMAYKLDPYLKARALGHVDDEKAILIAPENAVVNPSLLSCFAPHLDIVSAADEIADVERRFDDTWLMLDFYPAADGRWLHRELGYAHMQRQWEDEGRPPLIQLTPEIDTAGRAALETLGLPPDAWFVTLHVRESAYFREDTSWAHNRHRNSVVDTYLPAIKAIAERGGWVVRIGGADVTPLSDVEGVIDLATIRGHDPDLDTYCCAAGLFFLANESGPVFAATAFGVPLLGTNWFGYGVWPVSRNDLYIPKLLRNGDGRYLSMAEMVEPHFFGISAAEAYDSRGLEVIDNRPEDIRDAVVEMLDRLDGTVSYSDDEIALEEDLRHRSDPYDIRSQGRIARDFLNRHADVLIDRRDEE